MILRATTLPVERPGIRDGLSAMARERTSGDRTRRVARVLVLFAGRGDRLLAQTSAERPAGLDPTTDEVLGAVPDEGDATMSVLALCPNSWQVATPVVDRGDGVAAGLPVGGPRHVPWASHLVRAEER